MIQTRAIGFRVGVTAVSALSVALTACGGVSDDDAQNTAATESPIVNGTVLSQSEVTARGLAALYHKQYNPDGSSFWWPRPCSSTIVRSINGVSLVLTARHCVTRDGSVNGTPLAATDLRIIATAAPGPANPNPPSGTLTPASVQTMPAGTSAMGDMAIVTVNTNWSANVAARQAVLVADPSTLTGLYLTAYGYGINVADWNCFDNPSSITGAGIARSGWPFKITGGSASGDGGYYTYTNSNSSGQAAICGDSGGPDMINFGVNNITWRTVLGAHSGADSTTGDSAATAKWFEDTLGGLYMSSLWDPNRDAGLYFNGPATQLWLYSVSQTPGNVSRVKYYQATKQLIATANGLCMDSATNLVTCNGSTGQQWKFNAKYSQLTNVATGQCLAHYSTGTLLTQACLGVSATEAFARQEFAFHPQL